MSSLMSRYIPVLLIQNRQLYKTRHFHKEIKYVGDPINAIRIFNEKQVDEICVLDISASKELRGPDFSFISDMSSECFMPMGYGGGITKVSEIEKLFRLGVEKVILNDILLKDINIIREASNAFGSQSIVASVDIKKNMFGNYQIYSHKNKETLKIKPEEFLKELELAGAGEIILNSVDLDGSMQGYDYKLINKMSNNISIPLVALRGAGKVEELNMAITHGAHAAAAGSLFIFKGPHRAVLINYPTDKLNEYAL